VSVAEFSPAPPVFVQMGTFSMAYREWGRRPSRRAVVLIHGITGSSLSWLRVAPALATRYRVIAVDLKGHGDSDRAPAGYRFADQAKEVASVCQALELDAIAVIGHSWGGAVALQLATSTDLVQRLVLEDPALGLHGMSAADLVEVRESCANSVGVAREEAERHTREGLKHGWTELDAMGKVDAMVKGSPAAVRGIFLENDPWDLHPLLERLRCPTLLVRAHLEHGGIVDHDAVRLAEANPCMRVVTIDWADHDIHRTQFLAFMTEVEAFFSGSRLGYRGQAWSN
jgi:pimeloyl-ACP methyl ester carboxylesterase